MSVFHGLKEYPGANSFPVVLYHPFDWQFFIKRVYISMNNAVVDRTHLVVYETQVVVYDAHINAA